VGAQNSTRATTEEGSLAKFQRNLYQKYKKSTGGTQAFKGKNETVTNESRNPFADGGVAEADRQLWGVWGNGQCYYYAGFYQ